MKTYVLDCKQAQEQGIPGCGHEDCVVIVCEFEEGVSVSHAPSDIDPAMRLNESYPEAEDGRKGKKGKIHRKQPDEQTIQRLKGENT